MNRYLIGFLFLLLNDGAQALSCTNQNTAMNPTTPTNEFVVHDDGTVTHDRTGLIWMRCSVGQTWNGSSCTGSATSYIWPDALDYANNANYGGNNDWRLPNIKELESLVERRCWAPSVNLEIFPNTPTERYWSSSPSNRSDADAWIVDFDDGIVTYLIPNSGFFAHGKARLVRTEIQTNNNKQLTVVINGNGKVESSPSGISCEEDCSEVYNSGTAVTLTATPFNGATFNSWDGACSGASATCTVTMDTDLNVTANFSASTQSMSDILALLQENGELPLLDRSNTLEGPDENNNEVRDDIDNYISSLSVSSSQKSALNEVAKWLQSVQAIDVSNENNLNNTGLELAQVIVCLIAEFDDSTIAHGYLKSIEAYTGVTLALIKTAPVAPHSWVVLLA